MPTLRLCAIAALILSTGCKSEPAASAASGPRVIALKVTEDGFEPANVAVKKNEALVFKVTRVTDKTCATELLIDGTQINVPLPLNQTVEVPFTPSRSGEIRYGCAMGMMVSGVLVVD